MTRFARAAGSKSSNQRVPEDSTPWYVLKQQVADNKRSKEETHENETDWKNVLNSEKKIEENKNSVWCEFEEEKSKAKVKNNAKKNKNRESKNLEKDKLFHENRDAENDNAKSDLKIIKSKLNLSSNKSTIQVEEFSEVNPDDSLITNGAHTSFEGKTGFNLSNDRGNENEHVERNSFLKKKKRKRKFSDPQDKSLENQASDSNEIEGNNEATNEKEKLPMNHLNDKKFLKQNKTITWQKKNKEERPYKRRKLDTGDVKLEVNGQEFLVTRLDGFYIKKEDAERIRELEKDLLKRGVSKQEVRAVIKKERRNAEKSLARLKKKVCYHCRKGGHTLSSCPMLEDNGAQVVGSGICYKCGSTEHTHYQCKVNTGNSYKFATCFVCKQEGHISKQCPDNPRGMYPSGGGCRLCGDVTHFRRECPTLQAKSNKVTVGLMDQDIETIDGQSNKPVSKEPTTRKNKIVKFS